MAVKAGFRSAVVVVVIILAGTAIPTVKYVQGEKKLRMVNMVYRHGDRSPARTFPSDTNVKFWPQGLGQLTQKGMQQEYHLGEFLKDRYITKNNLLNVSYIRKQVYCRSTDYDRTIMSAQAQLNGLYPPQGKQVWRQGVKWQPIPVHVETKESDKILRMSDNCPLYNKLYKQSLNDPKYRAMELKYRDLTERLSLLMGYNRSIGFDLLYTVHDNLYCCLQHNYSLPAWANTTIMNILKNISDFQMNWLYNTKTLRSLYSGPLLGQMVQHMKSFKNKAKDTKKIYLYSAHDTTVAGMLNILDSSDGYSPPYSSAVMLELYSSDTPGDDFSVRIFYRIGQSETPRQLDLKDLGCEADCPLERFIELTKSLIPEDIDKACGVKKGIFVQTIIYKSFLAAFAGTLVILILLVICACCCWCRYRRSVSRASRIDFDDGMMKDAGLLDNQDYDSE